MASVDNEKMDRDKDDDGESKKAAGAEDLLLGKCPRCEKDIEISGSKFQWYMFFFALYDMFLREYDTNKKKKKKIVGSVGRCWNIFKKLRRV